MGIICKQSHAEISGGAEKKVVSAEVPAVHIGNAYTTREDSCIEDLVGNKAKLG
jgi:hypothetical protein